jgi:hypothetical protein
MISKLNPLSLAGALVWSMAILVSCLNFSFIQEIAVIREKNEGLRQEMLFQYRNAAQLNRVQSIQAFCSLPVPSAKLGFESIRSRLHGLSAHLGFQVVNLDAQMDLATENRLPFHLRVQGDFEKSGDFLAALRSVPYLVMRGCRIVVGNAKPDAELELDFDFQYKNDPVQELPIHSLQAVAAPWTPEAVAR